MKSVSLTRHEPLYSTRRATLQARVYTKREMDDISQLALQYDLFIISDEVYRDFIYDGRRIFEFCCRRCGGKSDFGGKRIETLQCMRCTRGIFGHENKEVYEGLLKMAQTRLSISYVDQVGAVELFKLEQDYLRAQLDEYENRRDTIVKNSEKSTVWF